MGPGRDQGPVPGPGGGDQRQIWVPGGGRQPDQSAPRSTAPSAAVPRLLRLEPGH